MWDSGATSRFLAQVPLQWSCIVAAANVGDDTKVMYRTLVSDRIFLVAL